MGIACHIGLLAWHSPTRIQNGGQRFQTAAVFICKTRSDQSQTVDLFLLRCTTGTGSLLRLHLSPSFTLRRRDSIARFLAHLPRSSARTWRRCFDSGRSSRSRIALENSDRAVEPSALLFQCVDNLLRAHAVSSISGPFLTDC